MPIKQWPADERPREKLLSHGPGSLSDTELLAILLRSGCAGSSALDQARALLLRFGGLRPMLQAEAGRLCEEPGMGPAKYAQLQAALELASRCYREALARSDVLTDPAMARRFLSSRLRDMPQEVFSCLYLDNRHRLIRFEELFRGTINGASVYPREVVRRCLDLNAAAVIFAHNHPSGVAEPSNADIDLTARLKKALALVEIRALDHIIIGDGETVSLAERGLM